MYKILIVDNSKAVLHQIMMLLKNSYHLITANSGESAFKMIYHHIPDLILLDPKLPDMDGKDFFQRLHTSKAWSDIPVIFLTFSTADKTEAACINMGAYDFIEKPIIKEVLLSRVEKALELTDYRKDLQKKLDEKTRQIETAYIQTMATLAHTIDAKDPDTNGHSQRVASYTKQITESLGWSKQKCDNAFYIALLHDVGKIGVPDAVLKKQDRLTDEEYKLMKQHPIIGANILKDIKMLDGLAHGTMYHHERYDGTGYPYGMKGEEIPLIARIISVADTFDAMTSTRCYRKGLTRETAMAELKKQSGRQFDPVIVKKFLQIADRLKVSENDNGFM